MFYGNEKKSDNKIIAEALARIINNQIEIKKHFGLAHSDEYYGDCYYDREIINQLDDIE